MMRIFKRIEQYKMKNWWKRITKKKKRICRRGTKIKVNGKKIKDGKMMK